MKTFTSSLPDDLLKQLNEMSEKLSLPKNKILEKALSIYLDQLVRAEYILSYKKAKKDPDLITIAEEGMQDYLKQMDDEAV
jgi:metal-responsive CopG/Arc/MetJ family transcriptional regulator